MRYLLPLTVLLVLTIGEFAAAQMVFTGYDVSFSKAASADETDPANQDALTSNVALTRSNVRGIYNAVSETFYANFASPAGTLWAFPHNNPGATLSASNWESLTFDNWEAALGSSGTGGPPTTVDQDAVLHLVTDDIYLDIRFTEWGVASSSGGSFSYERAAIPEPATAMLLVTPLMIYISRRNRGRQNGTLALNS